MESQFSSPYQKPSESYNKEMATQKAEELNNAVRFGSIETVRKLLEEGTDVNSKVKGGWTPLHSAIQKDMGELVQFLLDKGADPHAKKDNGATPFIIAGITGNVSLLKLFLEKGSDINEYDNNGFTAFMEAAWHGKEEALRFLYDNGADVNLGRVTDEEKKALNKGGATALMDAAKQGHVAIVEALVKEMEADVNTCDNWGRNALVHALSVTEPRRWGEGNETIALFLLNNGADVNKKDEHGKTTLILAAERESQRLVEAILERNEVDIDDADRNNKTALMVAVEKTNCEISKVLCEEGARTDIGNLLEIANSNYNTELTELLCKYCKPQNLSQPKTQWTPSSKHWRSKLQDLHGRYRPMIGKLKVFHYQDFRIKRTSQGGVYLGFYDGKEVAVKIFYVGAENAVREKTCLEKCHTSNNLVKLCGWEEQKTCLYVCLSLCEKNLEEYFQMADNTAMESKDVLKTIFLAVKELHSFGFGHQDLHPSNILIDVTGKIFLADFDKSREVAEDNRGDAIISEDLQALGHLVLYVAMKGKVSFEALPMECPEEVDNCMEVEDLRTSLGTPDKNNRVSGQLDRLIYHPYFWDKKTRYRVLRDVGNESDIKTRNTKYHKNTSEILEALNHEGDPFKGWHDQIEKMVWESMGPFRDKVNKKPEKNKQRYEDCVTGLLKLIRDMGEHFDEKDEELKNKIGNPADYFLTHFPNLTLYVYRSLCNTHYNKHFPNAQ
nr:2-5A-dependent ribonuclease [Pogona vitticeps]